MTLGCFQYPVSGMSCYSHALETIGSNIANLETGGFKRTDTSFGTLVSQTQVQSMQNGTTTEPVSPQSDLGGVRFYDTSRISESGEFTSTGRNLDVAIDGPGFFVLRDGADGTGNLYYGRDGSLSVALSGTEVIPGVDGQDVQVDKGYLVDKNGYFLQGWAIGAAPTDANLMNLRVDAPYGYPSEGQATSEIKTSFNLPEAEQPGSKETYDIGVFVKEQKQSSQGDTYDAYVEKPVRMTFTRDTTANTWQVSLEGEAASGASPGDTFSITPSTISFDANGNLIKSDPYQPFAVSATFADGSTSSFTMDLQNTTQLAGNFIVYDHQRDGYATGALDSISFSTDGYVIGQFDNGRSLPLYRLAIAEFNNPDGLESGNGNVYRESDSSGKHSFANSTDAASGGSIWKLVPGVREMSNVKLENEFANMIQMQHAYEASATAFKTMDEMLQGARDLMR